MTLVFAYGLSLDVEDWVGFCQRHGFAGARLDPASPALLLDAELAFDRPDGAPNLRACPGQAVEGLLFHADALALSALDAREGAARIRRHAVLPDGTAVEVLAHAAPNGTFRPPKAEELALIRRIRRVHGLPDAMLEAASRGAERALTIPFLFIYGTLMEGEANAHHLAGLPRRPGRARGVLHDCGPYPAMALGEGEVQGELVELPVERLAGMDALEGVAPVGAPGGLYRRTVLPVRTAGGPIRAYAYVMDDASGFPRIPDGNWRSVGDRRKAWADYAARTPEGER